MGGEVCHQKGRERGVWYEIQCIRNDVIAKEADGEDASFERSLLRAYKRAGETVDIPPRPRKKSTRKPLNK
jgi:hypothetical protein